MKVWSDTRKIKNAVVTIHGWSAGTAILHITGSAEIGQHASIWLGQGELRELAQMLLDGAVSLTWPDQPAGATEES